MRPFKTWDGRTWRRYAEGDEDMPDVVIAGRFHHDGALDPAVPVIARFDVVHLVVLAHRRFERKQIADDYAGARFAST